MASDAIASVPKHHLLHISFKIQFCFVVCINVEYFTVSVLYQPCLIEDVAKGELSIGYIRGRLIHIWHNTVLFKRSVMFHKYSVSALFGHIPRRHFYLLC